MEPEGVWVVYSYDTGPYIIMVFSKDNEIDAHRYKEHLGYGYVKFWEFATEWSNDVS
jgi:hypothetical protein